MSDDEEIIYKGKSLGLYNYLADLGYSDFETFETESLTIREQFELSNDYPLRIKKEKIEDTVSRPHTLKITDHDYKKLAVILSSELLFKEDAEIVETILHNTNVCKQRPNFIFHTTAIVTGLLSSVIILRSKVNIGLVQLLVPAGFTVIFSCYSTWQYYKEFLESRKDYKLMTHINDLKKLCFNILKLTRFIKETEFLSTGQVPINDIGSVLYVPSSNYKLGDINVSPQHQTVPHLRKCLSDSVEEVLHTLTSSINYLRRGFLDRELIENYTRSVNNRDNLNPCQPSEKDCSVSLLELKELTSKYLSLQSEYLKELAVTFSSGFLKSPKSEMQSLKFATNEVFEMLMSSHQKLTDISCKLMMQYSIHNIVSTSKKMSNNLSLTRSQMREISELQSSVHNVFLLLYSALLRVRNLEDTLENLSETGENLNTENTVLSSFDIAEQLIVLKNDLISTVRCYDLLCQQTIITSKELVETNVKNESSVQELDVKETGIVVGTSDFSVNSPDEVFLSLSGTVKNEENLNCEFVDDWYLERKPQIPKSLLTELSNTLKSRKTDFMEREKHALKVKGLQDIDNLSSFTDEDSDENDNSFTRKQDEISINYKRHVAAQDYSHSSDSDDEMDPFESGAILTKLKMNKKYQSDPYSDSDSSVSDTLNNKRVCKSDVCTTPLSTSSLANLAVLKSQMWGKNEEECYSDGSDS